MNNNSKKNFFNKKNIIIGAIILVLLFVFILFYFSNQATKNKIIHCTSTGTSDLFDIKIDQRVYYTNDVFEKIDVEYKLIFINKLLIENKHIVKDDFRKSFADLEKYESFEYTVEEDDNSVLLHYSVNATDYKNIEERDIEDNVLSTTDNLYDNPDNYIKTVEKNGGTCIYE